jgi:hypothetical protein
VVDPALIIRALNRARVDYLVIGGVAATLHGCPEQTYDLDILYAATPENRSRLLTALREIEAEWDRPLTDDLLQRQSVFALNTKHGDLDIFTSVPGIENFSAAASTANICNLAGQEVKMLDLQTLILSKEAAADPNPRKQAALAYLKAIQRKQQRS